MTDVDATRLPAMPDKSWLPPKPKLAALLAQLIPNLKLSKPIARLTHAQLLTREVSPTLMVPAQLAHNTRELLLTKTEPRDVPCHLAQA